MAEIKNCTKCGQTKTLAAFGRDKSKRDGLHSACKECVNKRNRVWNKANPDKVAKYQADWLEKNPERAQQHQANYRARHGVAIRAAKHGLTLAEYEDVLVQQDGICPICTRELGESPSIDHDHKCCPGKYGCRECVRGLLHRGCNGKLSIVEDSATLARAIKYLEKHGED